MKKYLLLLLIFFPIMVKADSKNFIFNCDKSSFKEFEEFTCRSSIITSINYNKVIFDLDLTEGIAIDSVRSNYSTIWKLEINDNTVVAQTKNNKLVNGLQEFGIFLFSTMESGLQKINIKNIVLVNTLENKTYELDQVTKEIKVLSSENRLANINVDNEEIIKFDPDTYVYKVNVARNTEKISVKASPFDETATVTGIGEITLNQNSRTTIAVISVKSESGINRNYLLYIEKEQILDANITLSKIELKDQKNNDLKFQFKPGVYEYNIEIAPNITSVNINAVINNTDLSFVKGFGNRSIDMIDGDNTVLIKVIDKNDVMQTYVINMTKLLSNKSANCFLKSLEIVNYDLKFNKRIKVYNLLIKKSTKKLDISSLTEDKRSHISITGNENLTTGSIIKIIVKAENESKMIYQIQISVQESNLQIIGLIILAFILIITGLSRKKMYKNIKIKKIQIIKGSNNPIEEIIHEKASVSSEEKASLDEIKEKAVAERKTNTETKKQSQQKSNSNNSQKGKQTNSKPKTNNSEKPKNNNTAKPKTNNTAKPKANNSPQKKNVSEKQKLNSKTTNKSKSPANKQPVNKPKTNSQNNNPGRKKNVSTNKSQNKKQKAEKK